MGLNIVHSKISEDSGCRYCHRRQQRRHVPDVLTGFRRGYLGQQSFFYSQMGV